MSANPETTPAPRQLADFVGHWSLARVIRHADGRVDRFSGTATWHTPVGGRAPYHETGTLTLDGGMTLHADRRYVWDQDLQVWFADGGFFHAVPSLGGCATHFCAPDTYDVAYDFGDWSRWQATWRVTGPAKDYVMTSQFAPADR